MRDGSLRITSDVSAPRISREHLASLRHLLEPRFDDATLVISELVTNSVRYGPEGKTIEIAVQADPDRIRLEVRDDGDGFDPTDPRGDGMGLRIVDRLADKWGVENIRRFTVWVELTRD